MRHAFCVLLVASVTVVALGALAASGTPEASGQSESRLYLPAALSNGRWQQPPAATPTGAWRATSTPLPTPPPGTPETPTPTPTPGAVPPAAVLAIGRVSDPDVAGDGARPDCQHLVVWHETDVSDGAIWGRFVERDRVDDAFLVSADLGAAGPPAVAYSAALERWLVVWPAPNVSSVSMLRGRMIACPAPEGPPIEIGRYFLSEDQPAVAVDGDGFAIVWRRSFSGRPDYQLVGVRVTGATVPEPEPIGDPGPFSEPALACEGTGPCLVAWASGSGYLPDSVFARTWTPRDGALGTDVLPVANGDLQEFAPSVAWNSSPAAMAYGIAWSVESRYRAVYARTLRGGVLGPAREVSMGLGGSYAPDIAPLAGDVVMAYALRGPLPEWELVSAARFAIAQDSGELAFAAAVHVSEGSLRPWAPAVAPGSGDDILVTWQDQPADDYWQIVARHVSVAAPAASPTPTATATPTLSAADRYLFVEKWDSQERGPGCPFMFVDFPMYSFSPGSGVLWASDQPHLEPSDVGYYGSGGSLTGRGSGAASRLARIEALPFDAPDLAVQSVSDIGGVTVAYGTETFDLAPGAERRWQYSHEREQPGCVITTTLRITNFGYQDRAKIQYDR